jgi:hypothetical protein
MRFDPGVGLMMRVRGFACVVLLIVAMAALAGGGILMMADHVSGTSTDLQLVWVRGAVLFGSGLLAMAILMARFPWDSADK